METFVENRVNCWDTLMGQSAAKLGKILSCLEGSTAIPKGSRIKRSEAHDTLREKSQGDDMVCSAWQHAAACNDASREIALSTEHRFTQTVVEIAPVALIGQGGGVFGAIAQNAAGANSGAMNNGNGQVWIN